VELPPPRDTRPRLSARRILVWVLVGGIGIVLVVMGAVGIIAKG